ncbi:unnamed protein product [Mortierella alpina]
MTELQPLPRFDLITSNMQLDNATCLQNPPCAACIVVVARGKEASCVLSLGSKGEIPLATVVSMVRFSILLGVPLMLPSGSIRRPITTAVTVKPCAAYLHYVQPIIQPGTSEQTLHKFQGFTTRFNVSEEFKKSVKLGIKGCESNLGVTTKSSLGLDIEVETKETWKTTLPRGNYAVFQTVLLYAYRIDLNAVVVDAGVCSQKVRAFVRDRLPALTLYDGQGSFSDYLYFFVPVFRNDPFTVRWSDRLYDAVEQDALIEYLMGDGVPRWESPAPARIVSL